MDAPVSIEMKRRILDALGEIAQGEQVRILFAVESGSRAWGFHSPDSDYDVRFIYARQLEDYLTVLPGRDVIELPIDAVYDLSGWDIRKALALLEKGNPTLMEWLVSPIVYREEPGIIPMLRALASRTNHRTAARYHYRQYGLRQITNHIAGRNSIRLKKYFYIIRPALALRWLRQNGEGQVPMDLPSLLAGTTLPAETAAAIEELRQAKRMISEIGEGPRIAALDNFVEEELALAANATEANTDPELRRDLDQAFRTILNGASTS